jgi:hypothetical protein
LGLAILSLRIVSIYTRSECASAFTNFWSTPVDLPFLFAFVLVLPFAAKATPPIR